MSDTMRYLYYSEKAQSQRLAEMYLSNTFPFKDKTAEEFAAEYAETVEKIYNVLDNNHKSKRKQTLSKWVNVDV